MKLWMLLKYSAKLTCTESELALDISLIIALPFSSHKPTTTNGGA